MFALSIRKSTVVVSDDYKAIVVRSGVPPGWHPEGLGEPLDRPDPAQVRQPGHRPG
jgi:hypothetical protein